MGEVSCSEGIDGCCGVRSQAQSSSERGREKSTLSCRQSTMGQGESCWEEQAVGSFSQNVGSCGWALNSGLKWLGSRGESKGDILLRGVCSKCGHQVVRVVETSERDLSGN